MIKLPKCPHCQKLMIPHLSRSYSVANYGGGGRESRPVASYLCPEKLFELDVQPEWVEISK